MQRDVIYEIYDPLRLYDFKHGYYSMVSRSMSIELRLLGLVIRYYFNGGK